ADEAFEVLAARDEVGLRVDLDDGAARAVLGDRGAHLALGRDLSGARRGFDDALLQDDLDGLVEIALGLFERRLAVANPGLRALTQVLDHLRSDLCHFSSAPRWFQSPRRRCDGRRPRSAFRRAAPATAGTPCDAASLRSPRRRRAP